MDEKNVVYNYLILDQIIKKEYNKFIPGFFNKVKNLENNSLYKMQFNNCKYVEACKKTN